MKLKKRKNGYFYIYHNRDHRQSLKTKDKDEATKLFNAEKELTRQGKVISFEKISKIKLSEFKKEYIDGCGDIPRRDMYCAAETIDNDDLAFRKFIELCGDLPLRLVKRKNIDDFKSKCLAKKLTMTYINILLRSLRAAFNTALAVDYITENPFVRKNKLQQAILFKLDKRLPRFYTFDEIKALHKVIGDPDFLFAVKIYLYHGIRRAELVNLQAQDIDFDNWSIKVFGKGRKERNVPIPEEFRAEFRQNVKIQIGRLFPRWTSKDTFSRLFHEYAVKAGIEGHLHDLRHTYATYLRMGGAGIDEIQKLLGHRDIKTTQIYAEVVDAVLKESTNKLKYNFGGGN